jgi:hypothetical protein
MSKSPIISDYAGPVTAPQGSLGSIKSVSNIGRDKK